MTWNKAAIAALGPALTTILLTMDNRMGWNLGAEFWGAVLTVAFGVLTFIVPNVSPAAATLKSVAWFAILITLVLMLSGCSVFPQYQALKATAEHGVETAIQDRKDFNDTKADVYTVLPCDMSLGAAMRIEDQRKKAILIELCGGPAADSQITVEDIATLLGRPPLP